MLRTVSGSTAAVRLSSAAPPSDDQGRSVFLDRPLCGFLGRMPSDMDALGTPPRRQIFIKDAAFMLNRRKDTVRKSATLSALPTQLPPQRANPGWRWWTVE